MKIGFELEAFCFDLDGQPILVPKDLPYDECGWLVEVRSEPHTDITKALFLLRAEAKKVDVLADKAGVKLLCEPLFDIPRVLKVQAAREHMKGLLRYQNIYGHETHRTRLATASIHVSFTNEREFGYHEFVKGNDVYRTFRYPGFVDHAKIIASMDQAFKEEIRAAKRNPGFYEVKGDGRIEYRSLPNNVDLDKLENVLQEILK